MIQTPSGVYYSVSRQVWFKTGDGGADKDYDDIAQCATFREALEIAQSSPGIIYVDEHLPDGYRRPFSSVVCIVSFGKVISPHDQKAVADCLAQGINERKEAA